MAYIKMTTRANGKQVAEVFVKGEELLKVLQQQGIHASTTNPDEQYCLTFQQNEEEKY